MTMVVTEGTKVCMLNTDRAPNTLPQRFRSHVRRSTGSGSSCRAMKKRIES
jgi:hypothetical protein